MMHIHPNVPVSQGVKFSGGGGEDRSFSKTSPDRLSPAIPEILEAVTSDETKTVCVHRAQVWISVIVYSRNLCC